MSVDGRPSTDHGPMKTKPGYFYIQSGVLPYRVEGGVMRVLLITSQGGRRWVIPKGIVEPGLSAVVSAAKEALEEAGNELVEDAPAIRKADVACEVAQGVGRRKERIVDVTEPDGQIRARNVRSYRRRVDWPADHGQGLAKLTRYDRAGIRGTS